MKPLSYPIVRYYLREAETLLRKQSYLGALLVVGTLSELLVRELADDERTSLKKLLRKLLNSSKITEAQFQLFERMRKIRNRYIHINLNKVVHDFDGKALVNRNGIVTFLNEEVLSSPHPEKQIVEFYKLSVKMDSLMIFGLMKEVIEML